MNTLISRLVASFFALLASTTALAEVRVQEAWVRGTVAQQRVTGAFMQIRSDKDARLVAVKSPLAGVVEIHEMLMDSGVMKMRTVAGGLALPAGKTIELKPGGYHVMLMDLKQAVKNGESVPLTLVIENNERKRENVEVKASVKPLGNAKPMDGMHQH